MIRSDDTGKLILRLALGIMILLHGIAKLTTGVGFVSRLLVAHDLPAFLAYAVFIGEILAPVLIIVGVYTRAAAWIVFIDVLVAIWLVHLKDLWLIGRGGGWAIELEGMFLFAALAIALMGAGRFSLAGSGGHLN